MPPFIYNYSSQVIPFIEELTEKVDGAYATTQARFEWFVNRSATEGGNIFIVKQAPVVIRCAQIIFERDLRALAMFYMIRGQTIDVGSVRFFDELPKPPKRTI